MTALITAIAMSLLLENLAQAIPAIGPNPKVASQIFTAGGISFAILNCILDNTDDGSRNGTALDASLCNVNYNLKPFLLHLLRPPFA